MIQSPHHHIRLPTECSAHVDASNESLLLLGNMTHLVKVALSENQDVCRPNLLHVNSEPLRQAISPLSNLKELEVEWLKGDSLEGLVETVSSLTLKSLTLLKTECKAITGLGRLSALEKFHLEANELVAEDTQELSKLVALRSLTLRCKLGIDFAQLQHVVILDLSNNKLKGFPQGVLTMTQLDKLFLQNNSIGVIPAKINQLSNLSVLNLANTSLFDCPSEIGALTKLTWLSLADNTFVDPNSSPAGSFVNFLESCGFYRVDMQGFPSDLDQLTNLVTLRIDGMGLDRLPSFIFRLPRLPFISADRNNFTYDPSAIALKHAILSKSPSELAEAFIEKTAGFIRQGFNFNPLTHRLG